MDTASDKTFRAMLEQASRDSDRARKGRKVTVTERDFGKDPFCENCGYPFDSGDSAIWSEEDSALFCGHRCQKAFDYDGKAKFA